jgi:hypothetical protein
VGDDPGEQVVVERPVGEDQPDGVGVGVAGVRTAPDE